MLGFGGALVRREGGGRCGRSQCALVGESSGLDPERSVAVGAGGCGTEHPSRTCFTSSGMGTKSRPRVPTIYRWGERARRAGRSPSGLTGRGRLRAVRGACMACCERSPALIEHYHQISGIAAAAATHRKVEEAVRQRERVDVQVDDLHDLQSTSNHKPQHLVPCLCWSMACGAGNSSRGARLAGRRGRLARIAAVCSSRSVPTVGAVHAPDTWMNTAPVMKKKMLKTAKPMYAKMIL